MGFEPTRAEPIGLAVQRLNHSATSSIIDHFTMSLQGVHSTKSQLLDFLYGM